MCIFVALLFKSHLRSEAVHGAHTEQPAAAWPEYAYAENEIYWVGYLSIRDRTNNEDELCLYVKNIINRVSISTLQSFLA